MVAQEVVLFLPRTVGVELLSRALVQVNEGHALGGGHVGCPLGLRLTHYLSFFVVSVAWSERHQNGVGTLCAYLIYITAQVVAVTVDGVLPLGTLVEAYVAGVGVNPGNDGTGTPLVEELAVVVMADADDDPVAGLQGIADGRPQVGVEGAGGHAAQRLVLDGYLVGIEVLVSVVAPAPLAVGAVAPGAVAHRAVAHKVQHRVRPTPGAARLGS